MGLDKFFEKKADSTEEYVEPEGEKRQALRDALRPIFDENGIEMAPLDEKKD